MPDKRNNEEDIVEGEIVGELHSETLLNLPSIPEDDFPESSVADDTPTQPKPPPAIETGQAVEFDQSRRNLLTRMALGGLAALALGGSSALVANNIRRRNSADAQVVVLPNGDNSLSETEAALTSRITELEQELLRIQAERDNLITELGGLEVSYSQLEDRCTELENLNVLWEQHNSIGLDDIAVGGLSVLGGLLGNLLRGVASLSTALNTALAAVSAFATEALGARFGMSWLKAEMSVVSNLIDVLAQQVEAIVEPAQPLISKVSEFVLWVLDRLPFGAGNSARAGMEAMEAVVAEVPTMLDGLQKQIVGPLGNWFESDNEQSVFATLINPVRQGVLNPLESFLEQVTEFEQTFQQDLSDPIGQAIDQRQQIIAEIETAQANLKSNHIA